MELKGIHHVSALTAKAPENYHFYTKALGLRLIKKTVNQDDISVYHLFYGDEEFEHLGESLALPPFLESKRSIIEAKLKPLDTGI